VKILLLSHPRAIYHAGNPCTSEPEEVGHK